ncbi:MAG: Glycosyl transferase group 1 [Candidatus Jorgensenbacteria bacterium GW2011_GWA1_48_13]|uniref:Glycosyl transferase group 1 n=2 Tax=Candidatus Joergenseniibacteriota TaxID=1752739 RepID=A0A0G1Z813_9BACT|nr:MAG: Glycosyl transferase group 1 [Candidatus Jorgensenbacteria bacterium GW2011_GWA1_48_13]KKU99023.1 MAG: Glycosyl transferase group 1 [Candidatus Jorgensenbacteria bacterium GW2011_GWC1_48_8]KKW15099.1 MAG: Glycosyl transferase group 1 [Candidatus Jorgensenbacteria bacterium GW2011_GWB1_50_10]
MLPIVETRPQELEQYRSFISGELFEEIKNLAEGCRGRRVFHVNSAPRGGGVAEILKSLVPLMKGLGLEAEWYTIPPHNGFFEITKKMHNALQGKEYEFPFAARKKYMLHVARTAELMREMKPDVWVIHDPQPAGVAMFLPQFYPSISRIHIDLTSPNHEVWEFVSSFLASYDKVIVSSPEFVKKEIKDSAVVFQPAIDPLSAKNQLLPLESANETLRSFGINPDKPLIAQISRFDPWKNPLGVIEAYQLAKKKIPDLQLALVGFIVAQDDPEAERIYRRVRKKAEKDPDIFLFADITKLGSLAIDVFVGTVQTAADVILQKSVREGFGMTVAEAMWKEKPVVAGEVGGIKLQIEDGKNGFFASNSKEAASRIVELIENPDLAKKIGEAAKTTVREKFLIPRLLRDYLRLFKELV